MVVVVVVVVGAQAVANGQLLAKRGRPHPRRGGRPNPSISGTSAAEPQCAWAPPRPFLRSGRSGCARRGARTAPVLLLVPDQPPGTRAVLSAEDPRVHTG